MAVIVPEIEFIGLLVWVGFCGKCLVLIIVMAEVLRDFVLLVPAILSNRCPGNLERKQAQHKDHEKPSHGRHCNYYGLILSMMKLVPFRLLCAVLQLVFDSADTYGCHGRPATGIAWMMSLT